ncbi:MAG: hypothetical protein IK082_00790 [Oscillospiraceae bacterium]|nr:hypothetical protein [Oscillospiraceae bacterium]
MSGRRTRFLALAFAMVILSCGRDGERMDYTNRPDGCQIGETIILDAPSHRKNVYHAGFEKAAGLCRDPLCQHTGLDGPCPDMPTLGFPRRFCTDGETLFMLAHYSASGTAGTVYQIYAVDPAGVEPMRLLCTTENAGNYGLCRMTADDRYLYYAESRYRDGAAPDEEYQSRETQYIKIMRIRKTGGKPELVFDLLPVGTQFDVDESCYYLMRAAEDMDGTCEIISKTTGEKTAAQLDGMHICSMMRAGEHIFFLCGEEPVIAEVTEKLTFPRYAIAEWKDGLLTCTAEHVSATQPVFSSEGRLWYFPFYIQFLETRESPTGQGSETAMHDFYQVGDNKVFCYDPDTRQTRQYRIEGDGEFIGFSEGIALGRADDGEDSRIVPLTLTEIKEGD